MLTADNEVAGLRGEQAGAVCKAHAANSPALALPRKYCYQAWEEAIGMSAEYAQCLSGGWACGLGDGSGCRVAGQWLLGGWACGLGEEQGSTSSTLGRY